MELEERGLLAGITVVNLGVNLPAVAACGRLAELGARVVKVEPPGGDPMAAAAPALYADLTAGQDVHVLDLKSAPGRAQLDAQLARADVLITSTRPSALARLGLGRGKLARHAALVHVAIVGEAAPDQEVAGHDLTYLAHHGMLDPPALPATLVADLGGAERAATTALALLLARERAGDERYAEVALADAARFFALPRRHGVTARDGLLGGGDPAYAIYPARRGWVAVAALEPHFRDRLAERLDLERLDAASLAAVLVTRDADDWERWARSVDVPLAALREPEQMASTRTEEPNVGAR